MKTKKKTVRYYTDSGIYKGWEYFKKDNIRGYTSWLNSGNQLMIGNKTYNSFQASSLVLTEFK